MVKTQAGKFLSRDVERALGKAAEPIAAANALSASCCGPAEAPKAAEAAAGAPAGDAGGGCGCGGEGQ